MKDIITFAAGSLAAFLTWLYPPYHKVDYYTLAGTIIIILILLHIIYKLYRNNKISFSSIISSISYLERGEFH